MKSLKVKKENGLCWVYLSRPDSMNALNKELLEELTEFNNNLKNDLETKVVIYSGDGENFSAGADIKEKNSNIMNNPKCLLLLKKNQKISRNDRCEATGKKFKNCCGAL